MKKMSVINRIVFLCTAIVSGFMVISGMGPYSELTTFYFTVAFGMLVLASILLMLLGFEILENNSVLVLSALIPVGMSLGMVNQYLPQFHRFYLWFSVAALLAIILTRLVKSKIVSIIAIGLVHGISGSFVFFLPILLVFGNGYTAVMLLIPVGGLIIGITGMLLGMLKGGKQLFEPSKFFDMFPKALLLATLAFVSGLYF